MSSYVPLKEGDVESVPVDSFGSNSLQVKKSKRSGACSGLFCSGHLSGFLAAVIVCSVLFTGIAFAYMNYGVHYQSDRVSRIQGNKMKEGNTGMLFETHSSFPTAGDHTLLGVGVHQKRSSRVTINGYAVGLYVHTELAKEDLKTWKDTAPKQLLYDLQYYDALRKAKTPKTVRLIFSSNLMNYASLQDDLRQVLEPAIANHVKDSDDPAMVASEKTQMLVGLFTENPRNKQVYDLHCDATGNLYVNMNGSEKPVIAEPLLCDGLMDVFIGPNAQSATLNQDLTRYLPLLYGN